MTYETDFHRLIETTLVKRAWKILTTEIGAHRRKQLITNPERATTAEILIFERLTGIPAAMLITQHGLGTEVLTQNEMEMHQQRNQHNTILPPYEEIISSSVHGQADADQTRNRRSRFKTPESVT